MAQSGQDMQDTVLADGLVGLLKPVVEEIDERVRAVRWAILNVLFSIHLSTSVCACKQVNRQWLIKLYSHFTCYLRAISMHC